MLRIEKEKPANVAGFSSEVKYWRRTSCQRYVSNFPYLSRLTKRYDRRST